MILVSPPSARKGPTKAGQPSPAGGERPTAGYVVVIVSIYLLALAGRLWRISTLDFPEHDALVALLGQSLLNGTYPLFLFGGHALGGVASLFFAPLLWLLGPSLLAVAVPTALFNLFTMALVHALLKRFFSPAGVVVGLLAFAAPPALGLYFAGSALLPYQIGIFLAAWLMLYTSELETMSRPGRVYYFLWGLLAGFTIYASPQTIVVVVSCFLFTVFLHPKRFTFYNFILLTLGVASGCVPVVYFNLFRDFVHFHKLGLLDLGRASANLQSMVDCFLPAALGVSPLEPGAAGFNGRFWLFLGLGLLLAAGALRLAYKALFQPPRTALLPVLVAGLTLLLMATAPLDLNHPFRFAVHTLPLVYLGLPFFWGSLANVGRSRPRLGRTFIGGLTVLLVLAHLYGYLSWWHGRITGEKSVAWHDGARMSRQIARLRKMGVKAVYIPQSHRYAFYSGGNPVFSHPWAETYATNSVTADAAANPAWALEVRPALDFLGLKSREVNLEGLKLTLVNHREGLVLVRAGREKWRASDQSGRGLAGALFDSNASTGFVSRPDSPAGAGFTVDLGRSRVISGLALLPLPGQAPPQGLKLEIAGSGQGFKAIRPKGPGPMPMFLSGPRPFLKKRFNRLECYFPEVRARYVRISSQAASLSWGVSEVLVWGPSSAVSTASWGESAARLVNTLKQYKLSRIYADAWPAALIRRGLGDWPQVRVANLYQNLYGAAPPLDRPLMIDPREGNAVIVTGRESRATARLLKQSGVGFTQRLAGRFVVFILAGRRTGEAIRLQGVSADIAPRKAAVLAGSPEPGFRWTTGGPQHPGQKLRLDLGESRPVEWLKFSNPGYPRDFPRGITVRVSEDGRSFKPVQAFLAGPLAFSGPGILREQSLASLYRLAPGVKARYLEISPSRRSGGWWWSVQQIRVLAPGEKNPPAPQPSD